MKHLALFLAIVIFALSLVSCDNLTYYKGAGWSCPQEEFLDRYYDPIANKIMEISKKHDINGVLEGTDVADDHFVLFVYDANFTARFDFSCEELWGVITADFHFYGTDESQLQDFELQRKYVNFLNEVASLFAYDVEEDTCKYEEAFNYCIENDKQEREVKLHDDAMTKGVEYRVRIGVDENVGNHTLRNKTGEAFICNCYHFRGLLSGDLDAILAS